LAAPPESRPGITSWQRALPAGAAGHGNTAPATAARPRLAPRLAVGGIAIAVLAGVGTWLWLRPAADSGATATTANTAVAESRPATTEPPPPAATNTAVDVPADAAEPPPPPAAMTDAGDAPAPRAPAETPIARAAPKPAPAAAPAVSKPAAGASPAAAAPGREAATTTDTGLAAPVVAPPPNVATGNAAASAEQQRSAVAAHAAQLQAEKAQCKTHVSELLGGRPITYADLAAMKGVDKGADGRLKLARVATDDGRRVAMQVDTHGCVVSVRVQ
jgi:type IV secretory pathway VirB10-like protein